MHIAIVGTRGYPYVYSGYETFVSELAPRLLKKGIQVTVYCHKGLFKQRPPYVNGIRLKYLPSIESKTLSQISHSLLATLHASFQNYDAVLFVNTANGPFGIFTKSFGVKTVINTDGLEWLRPKWRGLGAKYFYWASRISTRLFDVIVSDSTEMAKIYREEFGADSVTIAYGATPAFSTNPSAIESIGVRPGEYFLVVGRLVPDNNADVIVKGFESSSTSKKLVIVGDVPYRDRYAENIRRSRDSRILFPGYVRDGELLKELYCNSYAYLHGHEFGGTNPTLLKALAYGCCILALDTRFSREVLASGEYGLYFHKNPESISDQITFLDKNPAKAENFRRKARKRVETCYTWEQIADQYESLFQGICGNQKG